MHDHQACAGAPPRVGSVCRTVVGEHPLDRDPAVGEPVRRRFKHPDGRGGFLVVVDHGLGHP